MKGKCERQLKYLENRNRCKFCKVQFDKYSNYWYHQKKCIVDPNLIDKLNLIYENLEKDVKK